ncbi:hypothetical protein [Nocardioides sp. B-3]|uniref:hypothetical protein n=1 Tax=Nocardioides sp. B-3 TaxID=2895565 RepID=UPI0021521FF4|nr:hypothetical protein [Nocardioides sp. B-3]UUZ59469.1 hypothetical protein LP418_27430 [Nocardioides sp. B-3]
MTRRITIHINEHEITGEEMTAEQYIDLANAVWMVMRTTPFDFAVEPDKRADTVQMDDAWSQYSNDASWSR